MVNFVITMQTVSDKTAGKHILLIAAALFMNNNNLKKDK